MKHLIVLLATILLVACRGREAPAPAELQSSEAVPTATFIPATPVPPTATSDTSPSTVNDSAWWENVVFYEVFVRSFYDSDGDGIGDLDGLIQKLDYLNDGDPTTDHDLGVTALWLMPIMVSPSYHGYDVVDYLMVDPDYGSNEDFLRLMDEAHTRNIRVIVDLVMNHTSSQHPWFEESIDPTSERRNWYIWRDENPGWRGPWGQEVWHPKGGSYYYGVFWSEMPDLNYENVDATADMFDNARFWLEEMGVDGFRLDAIKHMVEEGQRQENSDASHAWLEEFHRFYKGVSPDAFTVGEAWTSTQELVDYTGDEVDIAFQFDLAVDMLNAANSGIPSKLIASQQEVYDAFPRNQYATFLTNHDQHRVMSQLRRDEGKAKLAASILFTAPGVPFIYYGEEIGMTGIKPDEDIRLPMQWTGNMPGVGFTEGTPWRAPADDAAQRNVAQQTGDPDSLLSHYQTLIGLRNEHEALRVGELLIFPEFLLRILLVFRTVAY